MNAETNAPANVATPGSAAVAGHAEVTGNAESAGVPTAAGSARRGIPDVTYRPLARDDLEQVHAWLNDAHVARWYSDGAPTRAAVRRKYTPRIDGCSPTRVFVALVGGRPSGLAQTYVIADYADYAAAIGAGPGWAGLDYLIGEPALRGRGLAHRLVTTFVADVIAATGDVTVCAALPTERNHRSIRALARAGFARACRLRLTPGRYERLMLRTIG